MLIALLIGLFEFGSEAFVMWEFVIIFVNIVFDIMQYVAESSMGSAGQRNWWRQPFFVEQGYQR